MLDISRFFYSAQLKRVIKSAKLQQDQSFSLLIGHVINVVARVVVARENREGLMFTLVVFVDWIIVSNLI